jgi:hypothetical protein
VGHPGPDALKRCVHLPHRRLQLERDFAHPLSRLRHRPSRCSSRRAQLGGAALRQPHWPGEQRTAWRARRCSAGELVCAALHRPGWRRACVALRLHARRRCLRRHLVAAPAALRYRLSRLQRHLAGRHAVRRLRAGARPRPLVPSLPGLARPAGCAVSVLPSSRRSAHACDARVLRPQLQPVEPGQRVRVLLGCQQAGVCRHRLQGRASDTVRLSPPD